MSLPKEGIPLEELERAVIRKALEQCHGNVSRAARFLSISRQTLIYRMKKYELMTRSGNRDFDESVPESGVVPIRDIASEA